MPDALFVVEHEFLDRHVGVLRVIAHYRNLLEDLGVVVRFAVADGAALRIVPDDAQEAIGRRLRTERRGDDVVWWRSGEPWRPAPAMSTVDERDVSIAYELGERVHASDFDVSVITCPWIADLVPAGERFTHGLVYDLVPNLAVLQVIDLGAPSFDSGWAGLHHRGYSLYVECVDTVVCISERTRSDFLHFYGFDPARAIVDVPFTPLEFDGEFSGDDEGASFQVLLVNSLDPRKGVSSVVDALGSYSGCSETDLVFVGRERMAKDGLRAYMEELAMRGLRVTWYRNASDALLRKMYRSSDVLLFPSIYEGLGLPILEAQSIGLPVVSSGWSSCGEINLNPSLHLRDLDPASIHHKLDLVRQRDGGVRRDAALRAEVLAWLREVGGEFGPFLRSISRLPNRR